MSLEIKDLSASYGAIQAVKGISLSIPDGSCVCLIGANGAGKTSTLRAIMGLIRDRKGEILLDGQSLMRCKPFEVVRKGIAMVPEGRRIFPNLTVEENLLMGGYFHTQPQEYQKDLERVFQLFPRLKERLHQLGGTLSGGEQQMLAVARALMSNPRYLLLDEPSLGLSPILVQTIFHLIRQIHKQGITLLLVEQNARLAMEVADYCYVLETGKIVLSGPAKELRQDERVKKAYLGEI
ncbi:MAG: ABC transporter ATP-binding protein [bacterium JZ-2024 1]